MVAFWTFSFVFLDNCVNSGHVVVVIEDVPTVATHNFYGHTNH